MKNNEGFNCFKCKQFVKKTAPGTAHRNHCPFCLWSKHLDLDTPGDRRAGCGAAMEPIGLTFKIEGLDKWGEPRRGELMLISRCQKDGKISINRLAGDDDTQVILQVFRNSQSLETEIKKRLEEDNIKLLDTADREEINRQLFGGRIQFN